MSIKNIKNGEKKKKNEKTKNVSGVREIFSVLWTLWRIFYKASKDRLEARGLRGGLPAVGNGNIGIFGDDLDIFIFFGQGKGGFDARSVRSDDKSIDIVRCKAAKEIGVFP